MMKIFLGHVGLLGWLLTLGLIIGGIEILKKMSENFRNDTFPKLTNFLSKATVMSFRTASEDEKALRARLIPLNMN